MDFKAYRRPDGAYVLVPDCFVASRDAQARHGPLVLVARFDAACPPDDPVWQRVLADLDRQSYAVVRRDTGDRLVLVASGPETA
ncbi:hypothetical protein [Cognatilysobacter lacus]|uniref:Uncharacterized protein n=1 Tax=Cognatilysobacter lacus TaxID=1643323 RepID=A0A5D8ZAU3_9GAMM|nr:hypothetical protein [Lysobacter lacus]TZF89804.1 hypothetical protein FW784_07815 [Lysobacter lacus]